MCLVVYIGSDVTLRTWPFDAKRPGFHVTDLAANDQAVRRHFSKPLVYYAGSHEGCGCGFQYGRQYPDVEDDPARRAAADKCRFEIEAFIDDTLRRQPSVEIYACWSGDEAQPATTQRVQNRVRFPDGFQERELLVVTAACPA